MIFGGNVLNIDIAIILMHKQHKNMRFGSHRIYSISPLPLHLARYLMSGQVVLVEEVKG